MAKKEKELRRELERILGPFYSDADSIEVLMVKAREVLQVSLGAGSLAEGNDAGGRLATLARESGYPVEADNVFGAERSFGPLPRPNFRSKYNEIKNSFWDEEVPLTVREFLSSTERDSPEYEQGFEELTRVFGERGTDVLADYDIYIPPPPSMGSSTAPTQNEEAENLVETGQHRVVDGDFLTTGRNASAPSAPRKTNDYDTELLAFMLSIAGIESGGANDPLTVQSVQNSGGRGTAKGIFQFLDETWRGAASKLGITAQTAAAASGEQQWKVAAYLMTQYFNQFKDWSLVATAWFAGPNRAKRLSEGDASILKYPDAYGTTVREYISKMDQRMKRNISAGIATHSTVARAAMEGATTAGAPNEGAVATSINIIEQATPNGVPDEAADPVNTLPPGGLGGNAADYSVADLDRSGHVDATELAGYIQQTYPQMLWALDHPELGKILKDAAERGLSPAHIYGQLIQTEYWKNHPESHRALENLMANDPATWRQMIDQRAASVRDTAARLGWNLGAEQAKALAQESLLGGWNQSQLEDNIVGSMTLSAQAIESGEIFGEAAKNYNLMTRVKNQYLLNLSDQDVASWTHKVMRGEADAQSFEQYARSIAEGLYPWMGDAMDRGITPEQVAQPYAQWVAQTLERNPADINMSGEFLDVMYDTENGRMRSLSDAQKFIRENYNDEWQRTRQAHEQYASVAEGLARTFGKVG